MKLRPLAIVLVGLMLVAVVVTYWPAWQPTVQQKGGKGGKRGGGPPSGDPVPVLAIDARRADVPVYLDGVGTARALNTVTVKPQVEGKLIAISFTEGQEVERGHVLAKIDPTTFQAQYDQAAATKAFREAQLANAGLDLERYERLAKSNAINQQQVDTQRALVAQLQAQVRADQATMDNARAILSYTTITAPIAGRTGIRQVDEGNIVRPSDPAGLVVIAQIKPISVFFNLPQQDLPELIRGMAEGPLPVQAMSADGRTALDSGRVLVIDNQVDPATGTVRLKAEFANADNQLWPGQFVNVRLLIDTRRQVVVVPTAALQRGPRGPFVFVIGDGETVAARMVTVAQQDDVRTVIGRGLEAGERVVTTGFARLAEGTRVAASSAEAAGQLLPPAAPDRRKRGEGRKGGKGKPGAGAQAKDKQTTGAAPGTAP